MPKHFPSALHFPLMQVESQLELAKGLSHDLNNRLYLKREDLQPVLSLLMDTLMMSPERAVS